MTESTNYSVADKLSACADADYRSFERICGHKPKETSYESALDMFHATGTWSLLNNIADEIVKEESEMRGFCERVEEAAKNREDLDVFGVEYMPLPLDKNGEPWHVGDRIETYRGVMREVVYVGEESVVTINGRDDCELLAASHYAHKESTVESVLKELIAEACGDSSPDDETIAKYAAKLRLKES